MRKALRILLLAAGALVIAGSPAAAEDPVEVPTDKGLPVVVRTGVFFLAVESIDEQGGTYSGTVDVRLRWEDSRLRFPVAQVLGGIVDLRGALAEKRLTEIWAPDVAIANLVGAPESQVRRLRIFPDGRAELMQRTTGRFKTAFDFEKFPFDRQDLRVDLVERREPLHRLTLDFRQDDVEFSRVDEAAAIEGWRPTLLHLKREPIPSWYGESQSQVHASLEVIRDPAKTIASVFLPLLASLLIPMLALWLQRVQKGEVQIEAFELGNILIGGLFAVIALNFTITSTYPALAAGDNTVTRLLGLNYLCLASSLAINVIVFRFDFVRRAFGGHVLNQLFRYLTWAMPVVVLAMTAAIILLAMA